MLELQLEAVLNHFSDNTSEMIIATETWHRTQ